MKNEESDKFLAEVERDPKRDQEYGFEEAFELTGHGRFNHLVLLASGLIMLNVSMESVGMSYAVPAARCQLRLSTAHKGLVNAAAFIGIISTSFLWGYLGDRCGRRAVMLPALLASAALSVASSLSGGVWTLLALRFLTGCLASASSATVYAYLGEAQGRARRAAAIAWGSAFISFSFIILPGLAWLIIPGKWSFSVGFITIVPWRAFMWAWCAPALAAAALLAALPESPRFVLAARGPAAALPVLATMYAWNHRCAPGDFPVRALTAGSSEGGAGGAGGGFAGALKNFSLLFRPPLLRCVVISHVSMFAVFMLSSGLYVWVPDILNSILRSAGEERINICQIIFEKARNASLGAEGAQCSAEVSPGVFPISMAMGAGFAATYLAIGLCINRLGRKTLYCGIMFACGLATTAAAFVPQGGAATALLVLSLCSGCAASILAAIAVDVFPTALRAMAMCVMYMAGRAGAAAGSALLGATLDSHCHVAFTLLGAFTAGSTILMLFWPPAARVRAAMEEKGLSY